MARDKSSTRANALKANSKITKTRDTLKKSGEELEQAAEAKEQTEDVSEETAAQPQRRGPGRPPKSTTLPNGLQPGEERFTIVADSDLVEYIRSYAWTERMTMRAVMEQAMREFQKARTAEGYEPAQRKSK